MSAFSLTCSVSTAHTGLFQSFVTIPITPPLPNKRRCPLITVSSFSIPYCCDEMQKKSVVSSRRLLNVSILTALFWDPFSLAIAEALELERYTDPAQGFTLLRPSSWNKTHQNGRNKESTIRVIPCEEVDKAGATVLFQDPNKGSNNVGVVVNPVRITTLSQFGSPQFVADKLILAEKRKESTKEAEVVAVSERTGEGGLQVYEFEYKVDSTRGGMKRIFSAAFVASRKLYLLNIVHSDAFESPIDPDRRTTLEEILHSFDTAPSI